MEQRKTPEGDVYAAGRRQFTAGEDDATAAPEPEAGAAQPRPGPEDDGEPPAAPWPGPGDDGDPPAVPARKVIMRAGRDATYVSGDAVIYRNG